MGHYKRCPVVFNLENHMQNDLYEWCMSSSTNFSDFARTVLFAYKQSQTSGSSHYQGVVETQSVKSASTSDADAMSDLL
jgi:hypothetical protein